MVPTPLIPLRTAYTGAVSNAKVAGVTTRKTDDPITIPTITNQADYFHRNYQANIILPILS